MAMHNRRSFGLAAALLLASVGASGAAGLQCLTPLRPADGGEPGGVGKIVDAGNGVRLIGAANGLYRLDAAGLRALRPAGGGEIGTTGEIVDAGNGVWLIGAENGLYRLDAAGLGEIEPADGSETGIIWQIIDAGDGEWLIRADKGHYRLDSGRLGALRPTDGGNPGSIGVLVDAEDGVRLIGTSIGLYRLDATELSAIRPADGGNTGEIREIVDAGEDEWLIRATQGFYRLDAAELNAIKPADGSEAGYIGGIVDAGNGERLIRAQAGLYRLDAAGMNAIKPADRSETGYIGEIVDAGNGVWLIGAEAGLYRLDGAGLSPIKPASGGQTGFITEIADAGNGVWLVGAEEGLYQLDAAGLSAISPAEGGETSVQIVDVGNGEWLIATWAGLYRLNAAGMMALQQAGDPVLTELREIVDAGAGVRLIGTNIGLYRLDGAGLSELLPAEGGEAGIIMEIVDAGNGVWHIGANALYRLNPPSLPTSEDTTRDDARSDEDHTFAWLIEHPCVSVLPDAGLIGVLLRGEGVEVSGEPDWQEAVVERPGAGGLADAVPVHVTRRLEAERSGATVVATLGFRPTRADQFQPLAGSETEVKVDWGTWDHVENYFRQVGPWALATQTVLFGGLLLAARRRAWAWNIVTDPIWGKVGLWFWAALRLWPALQRWVLVRWAEALPKDSPSAYLPIPLTGPDGRSIVSTELSGALGPARRVWLQGAAGMGKTVLIEWVVADWCAAGDLGAAFARWGYVPLPIALRDFAQVPVPTSPEEWLFDLAGRRLEAAGLRVEDARLLRGMLTAGYWVLLLDGANEVDDKGAVQQFARRFPQVGMLVTSQAEPRAEAAGLFEVWRLPEDIRAATGPLLALYLGPERGAEVQRRLEAAPIAGDIRSGYDVRLVADLVAAGTDPWALPATRLELYQAMLKPAGRDYPVADLARVAWNAWVAGRRDMRPGENIPAALLEPLKRPGVRVVRAQDGEAWQFRHDQMRAYLAARWAAKEEVSPVDLFEATPAIWRLSRSEEVVWEFFAQLLDDDANRTVLAWAEEEVERAVLQVALRRHWRARVVGWRPPRPAEAEGR